MANLLFLFLYIDCLYQPNVLLKSYQLGEGVGFVFWNKMEDVGVPVPEGIMSHYRWTPGDEEEASSIWKWVLNVDTTMEKNKRMIKMVHSAWFIIGIAGTASIVLRALYFNSLHVYLNAMDVFASLQDASPPGSKKELKLCS